MASYLQQYDTSPNDLVFIRSFGTPRPTTTAWGAIGTAIAALGGSETTFDSLGAQNPVGYDLAGGAGGGTVQASASASPAPGLPAQPALHGVLQRTNTWSFQPGPTDGTGSYDLSFLPIAYQPPTPWPLTNESWYPAAEQAIVNELTAAPFQEGLDRKLPDIHDDFWDNQNPEWPGIISSAPSQDLWSHTVGFSSSSNGLAPVKDLWVLVFSGTATAGSSEAAPTKLTNPLFHPQRATTSRM